MIKVAIRGLGKAGRLFLNKYGTGDPNVEVVEIIDDAAAVNVENTVYLLKYNSTYKRFEGDVSADTSDNSISINGKSIPVRNDQLGFGQLATFGADMLIDFTGSCTPAIAQAALNGGVSQVIANNVLDSSYPVVTEVNMNMLTASNNIVSTNPDIAAISSIVKAIDTEFMIDEGYVTFIKSASSAMTADDDYVAAGAFDAGRSCMENIVVGSNGAAKAIGRVIPELNGKLSGATVRVPSLSGFMAQMTAKVEKSCSVAEVNACIKAAVENTGLTTREYLSYSDEYITPMDTRGLFMPVFAAKKTNQVNDTFINIYSYYYPEEVACNISYKLARYISNLH